ncbi:hypothetical protein DYB32_006702 [Aphanomyces invadans]|uniref:Uncharacterized protein n=1 Tax=Aphanomyces invadans TaxID=157072 RepID=A0A3R6YW99_9STRA|nr:hypothetical protein DYB32_006702 [Aphanomyces invadans]
MTPKRRNLTDDEREAILREVLLRSNGSYMTRLPKGFSQELAEKCRFLNAQHYDRFRNAQVITYSEYIVSDLTIGISLGSLHRYLKMGLFRSHSNAIKALLTDANKFARLKHAVQFVGFSLELNNMLQYVHLDEKWFYITKVSLFDAAMVKLDGMTSAELRRGLVAELEDARCIDELAQALKAVALGDEQSDEMFTVLDEAGIDPISVEDDE